MCYLCNSVDNSPFCLRLKKLITWCCILWGVCYLMWVCYLLSHTVTFPLANPVEKSFSTGSASRKTRSKKLESKKLFFGCIRKPDWGLSQKRPFSADKSDCNKNWPELENFVEKMQAACDISFACDIIRGVYPDEYRAVTPLLFIVPGSTGRCHHSVHGNCLTRNADKSQTQNMIDKQITQGF